MAIFSKPQVSTLNLPTSGSLLVIFDDRPSKWYSLNSSRLLRNQTSTVAGLRVPPDTGQALLRNSQAGAYRSVSAVTRDGLGMADSSRARNSHQANWGRWMRSTS